MDTPSMSTIARVGSDSEKALTDAPSALPFKWISTWFALTSIVEMVASSSAKAAPPPKTQKAIAVLAILTERVRIVFRSCIRLILVQADQFGLDLNQ
jgi:hypothetical protein